MVITMDSKINKGRIEFNDENYEKALTYFDAVGEDDEDYDYVLIFKITCLMELERYDNALFLIDSLLAEEGDGELLLYEKIRCHIALDEKRESLEALKRFERIMQDDNKNMMLDVARFYKFLGEYNDALRFCNMALDVDGDFEDALYEKSLVAIAIGNYGIVENCANKLMGMVSDNQFRIFPVFLFKLYGGKYRECVGMIDDMEGIFQDTTCDMLRMVVLNQLREKLGVDVHVDGELSVGETIGLLLEYERTGVQRGIVNDIGFTIM